MNQQEPKRQPSIAALKAGLLSGGLLDSLEFTRFVFSGVVAACSNFTAVWLARRVVAYEISLVIGVTIGFIVSFVLMKWYAFGVTPMRGVKSELPRFVGVYCAGSAIYWGVAVVVSSELKQTYVSPNTSEALGVIVGSGAMMFATYLGHRYFTYRSYQRASGDVSG